MQIHVMCTYIYIDTNTHTNTYLYILCSGALEAQQYVLSQAKALAMTALDVLCNQELLHSIKDCFCNDLK